MTREDNPPAAAPAQPFSWTRPWADLWAWVNAPQHRWWFWPLAVGLLGAILLHPLDARIAELIPGADRLPGDVRREWLALQQFGAISSIAIIAVIVWLQSPHLRARLMDVLLSVAAAALAVWLLKMFLGRPRPRFADPDTFLGPFGVYPVQHKAADKPVLLHAWEFWRHDAASLWSMPSNHSAAAFALAAALAVLYPRLRWLLAVLAAIVAAGRLVFDAHYLTDVVAGVAVGLLAAGAMMRARWGSRLFERLTGRGHPRLIA